MGWFMLGFDEENSICLIHYVAKMRLKGKRLDIIGAVPLSMKQFLRSIRWFLASRGHLSACLTQSHRSTRIE